MSGNVRIMHDSGTVNLGVVDDPLKGFLRDKGRTEAERQIQIIQRKMTCVQEAMVRLVNDQRASAEAAGSDCMDLYLATNKVTRKGESVSAGELMFDDMKAACVLEWRAKRRFAVQFNINTTARLKPFDANHKTHGIIYEYVQQRTPNYYKVLAAFETARLTLNYSLNALRKMALDIHKLHAEAEDLPKGIFDKSTARLSGQLIHGVDKTGELTWILQGLYFEM